MNPIHKGHELVLNKVHDVAKKHNGDAHVVASHTEGNAKNPIPVKKKVENKKFLIILDKNYIKSLCFCLFLITFTFDPLINNSIGFGLTL